MDSREGISGLMLAEMSNCVPASSPCVFPQLLRVLRQNTIQTTAPVLFLASECCHSFGDPEIPSSRPPNGPWVGCSLCWPLEASLTVSHAMGLRLKTDSEARFRVCHQRPLKLALSILLPGGHSPGQVQEKRHSLRTTESWFCPL